MTSAAAVAEHVSTWRPPAGTVGLTALGQAGFAIRSGDDLVLIDAFLSPSTDRILDPVADAALLTGVRAVLATHEHEDHLDLPTWSILAIASPDARFVLAEPLLPLAVDAGIPAERITGVRIGRPIAVGAARVTAVPARHAVEMTDGYGLGDVEGGRPRFLGYVLEIGGIRIYHTGDTLSDPAITAAAGALRPDIALVPINGRDAEREARGIVGNLTPEEAAGVARDLGVTLAVPMHFDAVRGNVGSPDQFVAAIRRLHPTASVWVPSPGASFLWPAG